jgi:hypothetical protein
MNEQEEINEANADKKWLTYREHISKRFQMRSGKVLPPPPPGSHVPQSFNLSRACRVGHWSDGM